ncbi:SpoIIE family protein phosphatase [Kitasatospora sp. NPDC052896]|uniref:SpoIIE family protein phosphatase n=1 Tax=Kitasatospora sp. NPDC052896 TaxID=3364061 RepID=UPI0037CCBD15
MTEVEPSGPKPESGPEPSTGAASELAAEVAELRRQRAECHLLDLAAGVLVARLGIEPTEATSHLVSLAESIGQRPADLAADLLNQPTGRIPPMGPEDPAAAPEELARARPLRRAAETAATRESLDEVAATLLDELLRPLGVCGLLLWRLTDADRLELVGGTGFSVLERTHWQWLPPQWPNPLRRAVLEGAPLWLPAGPPDPERLPGPAVDAARAVLPLWHAGKPVGVALAVWPAATELPEPVRDRLAELTEVAARLLAVQPHTDRMAPARPSDRPVIATLLDLLAQPALIVRQLEQEPTLRVEHANAAARRIGTAAEPSVPRPLARFLPHSSAGIAELIRRAQASGAPQRAARLPAETHPGEPGALVNVRVLPVDPAHTVVLWHSGSLDHSFSVLRIAGGLGNIGAFEDDLTTGTARWSEQSFAFFGLPPTAVPLPLARLQALLDPVDAAGFRAALQALTTRRESFKLVVRTPRAGGGQRHVRVVAEPLLTHGTLTGITGIFQDVSAQYHTELALAATFDQLTTVREQAAVRHRLALQLQRAIVPEVPDLRKLPGLQVAARYRPAAQEYRVGGDWYDVLPLSDGRVMVAVGDVAGHGIEAATGMVALRNALRGLALTGQRPGRLLQWLNELTLGTVGHPTATGVCARYDPETRLLTWSSAGHLPPLLIRDGRAEFLEPERNVLLGALPSARYQESSTELRADDTLVLYTDGLIERRHDDLNRSLADLRARAERLASAELDEQADRLLSQASGDTDDDSSLIIIRIL